MKYYTLLSRDFGSCKWLIEFGDYDKDVVEDELESYVDNGYQRSALEIICTGDEQVEIDNAVNKLNGGK